MAKDESVTSLETALAHVNKDRRGFLKVLLAGSAAAAALPMLTSETLAQEGGGEGEGKGKKGKKGKKGEGKGDGDGKGG
jgi:hypothetical protein